MIFAAMISMCTLAAETKDMVEVVYDSDGLVEYVKINNIEHQVIPTIKVELMLDTIELKTKVLIERESQIATYQKISDQQKADLQMCISDRKQVYKALDLCISQDQPVYKEPTVTFVAGFVACTATYALWQHTQN
jgi:hypothetical protein